MSARKPGRPVTAPADARVKRVLVAVSAAELATLQAAAKRARRPLARYMREATLRRAALDGEA